jgi:hypothetical protein
VGREGKGAERRRGQDSAQGGGSAPATEQKQREQRVCRGRRRGKETRDCFGNLGKLKGFSENYKFSLIQRSNEKKSNMKVVEFFKLYKLALRFNFKNPRFATLQVEI